MRQVRRCCRKSEVRTWPCQNRRLPRNDHEIHGIHETRCFVFCLSFVSWLNIEGISQTIQVGQAKEGVGKKWRERRGSNPLQTAECGVNHEVASPIASSVGVTLGHDLAQVVAAWSKLSAPLKAAILAIVNSATSISPVPGQHLGDNQPGQTTKEIR